MAEHFDYKVEPPPLCKPGYAICDGCDKEVRELDMRPAGRAGDICIACWVKREAEARLLQLDATLQHSLEHAQNQLEGFDGTEEELYDTVEDLLDGIVGDLYQIQGKERWDRMFSEWAKRKDKPCEKS